MDEDVFEFSLKRMSKIWMGRNESPQLTDEGHSSTQAGKREAHLRNAQKSSAEGKCYQWRH